MFSQKFVYKKKKQSISPPFRLLYRCSNRLKGISQIVKSQSYKARQTIRIKRKRSKKKKREKQGRSSSSR